MESIGTDFRLKRCEVSVKAAVSLILGLVLGAVAGWYGPRYLAPGPSARPQPLASHPVQPERVKALGRIVPEAGVIEIGALPTELIENIAVHEGENVSPGALLATLSSYALLESKIQGLRAKLAESQQQAAAERNLIDAQIRQAELAAEEAQLSDFDVVSQKRQIELLADNLKQGEAELKRLLDAPDSLVSKQDKERQKLAVDQAEAELATASRNLEKAKLAQDLAKRTAEAQKDVLEKTKQKVDAQLPTASLTAELAAVKAQQAQTQLRAPVQGRILDISAHAGELVGNRSIMRMADVTNMAVIAEVYESAKNSVKLNQAAVITGPAIEKELRGHVVKISPIVASPQVRSLDPFAPSDRRVFEVKILLDDEKSHELARDLVNAPVDVTFGAVAPPNNQPSGSP